MERITVQRDAIVFDSSERMMLKTIFKKVVAGEVIDQVNLVQFAEYMSKQL